MKYILPLASVALALSLTNAIAAPPQGAGGHGDRQWQQNDRGDRGDRARGEQNRRGNWQPQQQNNNNDNNRWRARQGNDNNVVRNTQNDNNRWRNNDNRRNDNAWRNNTNRRDNNNDRWRNNNNWRNNQWTQYRRNFNSPRRFNIGIYHAPRGYYYHRYSYGDRLPSLYFARNYWLTEFLLYGLFAPPPGLIWVRYGPDALLVDQYTGEIVQVRYNVFY